MDTCCICGPIYVLLVATVVLAVGSDLALGQTQRTFSSSGQPQSLAQPGFPANARWEGDALTGIEQNGRREPILYRIDRQGRRERIPFAIPDASHIWIEEASSGPGGALGVVGVAYTSDGKGGTFVARVTAGQQVEMITQVWPYCPKVLTFTADNTIWTAGYVLNEAGLIAEGNVLRQFDKSGRVLRSIAVRADSNFPGNGASLSFLRASRQRVAWLTNKSEYIEFLMDGSEVFRISGPPLRREHQSIGWGLAVSEAGDVVMGATTRLGRLDLWSLDRKDRAWRPILIADPGPASRLLGFDEDALVVAHGHFELRYYRESPRPDQ